MSHLFFEPLFLSVFPRWSLVACGGGGGGGGGSTSDPSPSPPPATDTSPNSFSFIDHSEAELDTDTESNHVVINGINAPAAISITNGEYAIDDGDFTSDAGTVTAGQIVRVRVRSAAENNTLVEAVLTIGDITDTFSVTTEPLRIFEAETGVLLLDAMAMNEGMASGGQVVGSLTTVGSGIQFSDLPSAIQLVLRYSATSDVSLSVMLDGNEIDRIDAVSTGDLMTFADVRLDALVSQGSDISIVSTATDANIYLDSLTLLASPLQEVSTLANSGIVPPAGGFGADGLSVADNGDVFVSSGPLTNNIVRVTPAGVVSEFATGFQSANGSDFDSNGNLFVADYQASAIRRVAPDGSVSTFASGLDGPAGVYVDENDNVIVGLFGADFSGTGSTVLSIAPDGSQEVLAQGGGLRDVIGVVADEDGEIYAGNWQGRQLYRVTDGNVTLLANVSVNINMIDYSRGYIYIANNGRIVRVNTSTGEEELFSGSTLPQTTNGPIASAEFVAPTALAFSPDESILYVVDQTTGDVRKITTRQ